MLPSSAELSEGPVLPGSLEHKGRPAQSLEGRDDEQEEAQIRGTDRRLERTDRPFLLRKDLVHETRLRDRDGRAERQGQAL